jgi:polysaccharide biosynthesis protein PslH
MKLLFITPSIPYPPRTGNSMILLNHIRHLTQRHTVDLISFKDTKAPIELGDLGLYCNHIELVEMPPKWRVLLNKLASVPERIPFGVASVKSKEMAQVINNSLANTAYDAVIFQLAEMAQFRPEWFSGTAIWNLEDPAVLKFQRMSPLYPWYAKPLLWDRIARRKIYENRQAPRFDCILFVNSEDARDYGDLLRSAKLDWVPSAVDVTEPSAGEKTARCTGMVVMTGNMFHKPNVDAVKYFCREVFPLVCKRIPTAVLWLVGSDPSSSVRKWTKNRNIRVTGFVPDVRTYLRNAMVSVCPVRLRIGTQTKILEALACGTPVVTSSAGNHGIMAISGKHLYVADEPIEFAERIVALLNKEGWDEVSENGRRFVLENFSWESSTVRLEQVLARTVEARTANALSV